MLREEGHSKKFFFLSSPVAGKHSAFPLTEVSASELKCPLSRRNLYLRLQLFQERLSYKRREPYATMWKVIMGNGGFTVE